MIFTFKKTAEVLFGPITGNGHIRDLDFGRKPIFVMPGPYAPGSHVERRLADLGELADRQHSKKAGLPVSTLAVNTTLLPSSLHTNAEPRDEATRRNGQPHVG